MRHDYSTEVLQSILDQYPDLGAVQKHHLFTSGYENSNCYAETDKGCYVVKVYEGKDIKPENIHFEVEMMDLLSSKGLKVPHVLKNNNDELTTDYEGKCVVVMDYLDGENLDRKQASDTIVQQVGAELGKMDTILKQFPKEQHGQKVRQNYVWDLKNFLLLEDKVALLTNERVKETIKEAIGKYKEIKPTLDSLPAGLIHNDIGLQNILVDSEKDQLVALIDFSDAAFSPYIQNVATALCHLCFMYNYKPHQVKLFIDAYRQRHELSEKELSLLYDLILARFATVLLVFNWVIHDEGPDEQLKTYIKEQEECIQRFIDLGKEQFNDLYK